MNKQEIISIIEHMIRDDELGMALDLMWNYVQGIAGSESMQTFIILKQSNYNRNRKDRDIISESSFKRTNNQVKYFIMDSLKDLPEQGNAVDVPAAYDPKRKSTPATKPVDQTNTPPPPQATAPNTTVTQPTPTAVTPRKILFLTANPTDTDPLQIETEIRKVKDGLAAATKKTEFEFILEPGAQISTITKAMQIHKPEFVHFSGHGFGNGLATQGEGGKATLLPTHGLVRLFKLFKKDVKCVVLNACFSQEQAEAISEHGIHVVGMNAKVKDLASAAFSQGFYQGIGEGQEISFAFEIAMINISSFPKNISTPELWFDGKLVAS